MTTIHLNIYKMHRSHNVPAAQAFEFATREAETLALWEEAEEKGLVRIRMVNDDSPDGWSGYFDGDMFNPEMHPGHPGGARAINAERKRIEQIANDYGFSGIVGEYRTDPDGEWQDGDSVWGFLGNETIEDCGYAGDIMQETLDALESAEANRCEHCGRA